MPKYKLPNGTIVNVANEEVKAFLNSKDSKGAELIQEGPVLNEIESPVGGFFGGEAKTNAVVEPVATVTAKQQTATNMALPSVDGSLDSQEPSIIKNDTERYLNYTVDGVDNLVFESDFKIGEDGLDFDDFAESKNLTIQESLAAPVIKAQSRKSFILEQFKEKAYKKPSELSGFGKDGMQRIINNNFDVVEKIASKINGINYLNQNDENLDNLDTFAQQNKNKNIVVYTEGEDDTSYRESYDNIKNLKTEVEKLENLKNSTRGASYDQIQILNQKRKELDSNYEEHMRKFKTLRSNVEFITSKNLSKQRFESKGENKINEIIGEKNPSEVVEEYDYYGRIYLSDKEKEINSLYEKQKYSTGDDLLAIEKRLEALKEGLGNELYDPITGEVYNLKTAPKQVIESYDRSEKLAAKSDVDELKNLSFKKQMQLIGAAEDLYNNIKQSGYFDDGGKYIQGSGGGPALKFMLPVLEGIVKRKKLPANLSDLKSILSDSKDDGFYNFSPQLGDNFRKTLTDYLEINRALKTNTNILTSKDKEYFKEFVDSTVNKFGFDITTKREKQETFKDALLESGFTEDSVNEMNKGNSQNTGQIIARGVPDLAEFVFEVAVTRGATGNVLGRIGKFSQSLINSSYKGNKYIEVGSKILIPAVVEGAEFATTTAMTNIYKDEKSSVADSFMSGFSMGAGGKLLKGAVSSIAQKVLGNRNVNAKIYDYALARNIKDSRFLNEAYNSFIGASGGAGAYISGNILLDPFEFDYTNIGNTYIEETAKMFLLGKFQKTLFTGGGSIKKSYEDASNDILRFSNLNRVSYKAAQQLKVPTDIIKNPNEKSNTEVENAFNKAKAEVTKNLLKKDISREEAEKQYKQLEGSKKALEVQIGINQAKKIIEQEVEDGKIVSPGKQYLVGKKIATADFSKLTSEEIDDLSNMSPESILINTGLEVNDRNMNLGVEYVDNASRIKAVLDGKYTYESYKTGSEEYTGYSPYEFKTTKKELRDDTLKFLLEKENSNNVLRSLEKQYEVAKEDDKQNVENLLYKAKISAKNYSGPSVENPLGGEFYREIQSKLKGATFAELNKDYLEYIKQGGDPNKLVIHSDKQSFVDSQKNVKNKNENATAYFDPITGVKHINMAKAMEIKDISAIAHEGGHWILKDVIKDKDGNITPEGIKMIDELLDSMPSKDKNLIEQEVRDRYVKEEDGKVPSKEKYYEENLTVFVELVKEGKIKNDSSLRKTLEGLVPFLKKNKLNNLEVDINTGSGVLQLLESYAKGEKGVYDAIRKFQSEQTPIDTSEQKAPKSKSKDIETKIEELTDRFYEGEIDDIDYDQQLDNLQKKLEVAQKEELAKPQEVKKPKKAEEDIKTDQIGDAINKIIPKGTTKKQYDTETIGKVSEKLVSGRMLDPLIKKIAAGYGIVSDNVYGKSWEDFYDAVKGVQLLKNLQKFNPETNDDFGGFVIGSQFGIRNRVKEALTQFKKENEGGFKEDVETAKGIISEEIEIEEGEVKEKILIDPRKSRIVKDKLPEIEESIDIDPSTVTTLTFKNVAEKFGGIAGAKIFDIPVKKVSDPTANLTYATKIVDGVPEYSEAGNIQNAFTNPQQAKEFIKLLPEFNIAGNEVEVSETGEIIDVSSSAKGYAIGVPNNLIKLMYDTYVDPRSLSDSKTERSRAITSPKGRSKGLTSQATVYRLKPEFTGTISNEAVTKFQDMLGITEKGKLNKYNREIGQVLKSAAKLYGSEVANIIVRDKINKLDIKTSKPKSQVLADIAAGKSTVMFSKADTEAIKKETKKLSERFNSEFAEKIQDIILKDIDAKGKINIKDIFESINSIPKDILTDAQKRAFETAINTLQENQKNVIDGVKVMKEFRDVLIKEYEVLGNKFTYDHIVEQLSEAKSREDRIKQLKNFFADNTRSSKTGEFDGITTNKQVFEKLGKLLNEPFGKDTLKNLGFSVGTKKARNGKEISWIKHEEDGISGSMDITSIKYTGFGNKDTLDRVLKDSNIAITQVLNYIDFQKNKLKDGKISKEDFNILIESYLRYNKIDQRGLIRKISTPGFQIKTKIDGSNFKTTDLYLEHEMAADQVLNVIRDYAFSSENNHVEFVSKLKDAKVNIIPKYMADMLPKYKKGTPNQEGYNSDIFKIEFEKYKAAGLIKEYGDSSIEFEPTLRFSKNLSEEFNKIIENKTGIAYDKTISEVKAKMIADSKRNFNFFIPPSAEDFVGLLYYTLGKGETGDKQMQFYKRTLLDPYARANQAISRDRNALGRRFKEIKKEFKVTPKDLKNRTPDGLFTREQAVRVFIWDSIGKEVPGLSEKDVKELVDYVKSDRNLSEFATQVMMLNPGKSYTAPTDTWITGNITTDLLEVLNTSRRAMHLKQWQQNVDVIFSNENLNKLEAAYGTQYRKAMENILTRMKTGRNRTYGTDTLTGRVTDWVNGSVGAIMFLNTRSAVLQTISAANFINFTDNNVLAAGKALANQKQYWSDFATLFKSEYLVDRRDGLKVNVNEADIADIAKEKGIRGALNYLLKLGFTPTQIADSFAIASGGATFYRNRIKSLIKKGMDPVAAEKLAMRDFIETAEESQQSSRPDKISQQQAGPLGRIVLAFANTPAQYARLIKKAASDLKNGRGDAKTNISKILYYGAIQNIIFNALQQALFAMTFGDEEEESEKTVNMINGTIDGIARGTGLGGAVFTVVKNTALKLYRDSEKKNPKYEDGVLEMLKISPPISSKVQKLRAAGRTMSWDMDEIKEKGASFDNPAIMAGAKVTSAMFNFPADRAVQKVQNLVDASDSELETYKRLALVGGWSAWELGIKEEEKKKGAKNKSTKGRSSVKKSVLIKKIIR
jgi:hypothetical protein